MSFKDEYIQSRIGKEPERIKKIETLLGNTLSGITKAGLTMEETRIFFKLLEDELGTYRDRLLKTVPFVTLPDNLRELPYSDRQALLANLISEVQSDRDQAHT